MGSGRLWGLIMMMWDSFIDDNIDNQVVTYKTNDLRSYAYYGSAVELIRSSIEHI